MSQHLLSGARLHSLIGEGIHELPTYFIDRLERMLADNGMPHPAFARVAQLRLVQAAGSAGSPAQPEPPASLSLAMAQTYRKQHALEAVLEILHAAHESQHDGSGNEMLCERLVEGLIVAARELLKTTGLADGAQQPQ